MPTILEFSYEKTALPRQPSTVYSRKIKSPIRRFRKSWWLEYLLLLTTIQTLCHGVKYYRQRSKQIFHHIQLIWSQKMGTGKLWMERASNFSSFLLSMIVVMGEWSELLAQQKLEALRKCGVACGIPSIATTRGSGQSPSWRGWKW